MALFKIYRGNETGLPSTMNDGWAYFCTDSGNFYIDWDNDGILTRTQINANYANNLKYLDGEEYAEIDATTLIQGFTTMWAKITALEGSAVKSVNNITPDQSGNVEITLDTLGAQPAGDYAYKSDISSLGSLSTKDTVEKSDLASDVQTSLGKADTALQSYTETDPTVPAWAKAENKPSYTASEVGADPSGSAATVQANLDAHTNDKNNPHGMTLTHLGVTATAAELNYVDGVTSNIQTQLNKKANDYSIELYNGTGGNPKPVRFASFNYSTCNSENGISAKISLVSGHGNGSSYAFLEDAIIRVRFDGVVEVDNFKYYGASTGTYDGADRQYGDIFWLVDTTNKIVDFYCLMGQYARVYQTPWRRLTYSSGGTVTQHTSCTVYSSGEKTWANNSDIALISDIDLTGYLQKTELPTAINTALEQAKASGEFDGADGVSPTISVDTYDDTYGSGVELSITHANGDVEQVQIPNGKDGTNGSSAFVSVTKNGNVATITTRDAASGTRTVEIYDGEDYVLTDADKEEIAELAADMVEVPDSGGDSDVLVVTVSNSIASHSPAEIKEAKEAGKIVYLSADGGYTILGTAIAGTSVEDYATFVDSDIAFSGNSGVAGALVYTLHADKSVTEKFEFLQLPPYPTAEDEGKVLTVVNGSPTWQSISENATISSLVDRLSTLEANVVTVHSGTEAAMTADVGSDGDIYLVTE